VKPLLLLHGLMDAPCTWDLVRPLLGRDRELLAPALPGHLGGPPLAAIGGPLHVVDHLERLLDEAGIDAVDVAGNSLGGYLALRLAERGRATSVVALAPGGGWAPGDPAREEVLALQRRIHRTLQRGGDLVAAVATPAGRRRVTRYLTVRYEHIPEALLLEQLVAASRCDLAPFVEAALEHGWPLDAEKVTCPVRVVWGTADALLAWPGAAARYRELLPQADWVELDDVGHAPQLDVPLETAELIRGAIV
jgi:pimeloyl-ACP methyl ester carboxylesterase